MRKVIGTIILLGVEGVGSVMLETTIIPTLFAPPLSFVLFGVLLASALVFWFSDIKAWLNPNTRIYRRGIADQERRKRECAEKKIGAARETKILHDIRYDPDPVRITGDIIHRSWKGKFLRRLAWLPTHHIMPASVYIWIVKRLGWTTREPREGELDE